MKRNILTFTFFCFVQLIFAQVNLNPCTQNHAFKIVVLGSSTAAGSGPSHSDSTWVNKYRKALQSINPQNQVINLAVGGYTTYKEMPNSFVAPAGRPAVDTLHNITAALKLNPDAIIINLPSNDRQWPMNEQLSNFDSLYNHSTNSGVPFFVCTTQPIAQISYASYQLAVRDSILANFGMYAIDLFQPLADTNNTVLPQYAADAVHLNDAGHAIILNQVWNADVLGKSFVQRTTQDLALTSSILNSDFCTDSSRTVGWIVANLGDTAFAGNIGYVKSTGPIVDSIPLLLTTTLLPCHVDTLWTNLNAGLAGNYNYNANITLPADTFYNNNQLIVNTQLISAPHLKVENDTACLSENVQFTVQSFNGDTLLWYSNPLDTIPTTLGGNFVLQKDTVLFAQGVNGSLKYQNQLLTLNESNINFYGNMFDILPLKDISLSEIEVRIKDTGFTPIKVYTKAGSYRGHENTASDWNLIYHDTVYNSTAESFVLLDILDTNLLSNDTLGFYVSISSGSNRVLYKSTSQVTTYSSKELSFISGAGISPNFGTVYDNRILNVKFNYNFGFNRLGQCATPLQPIEINVAPSVLNLGSQVSIPPSGLLLDPGINFTNHFWVNGNTGDTLSQQPSLWVDSALFTTGNTLPIICYALNKWGCFESDTVLCTRTFVSVKEEKPFLASVYPNPARGQLNVVFNHWQQEVSYSLFTISGTKITTGKLLDIQEFKIDYNGVPGLYILTLKNESGDQSVIKIINK